mmetsp:Transcript_8408/g.18416  ORF Transcript_8408/g.18416 Transcript_8408/m.18416 type:complete len:493 (+) Transcript_8408:785-2263(+)
MRKSGDTHGTTHVVREHEEGRARHAEWAVVGHAVHDGAHGVLANTVVEVAAGVVVLREISDALHVILVRAVEISGAREVKRHGLRDRLQDVGARVASGDASANFELIHHRVEVRNVAGHRISVRLCELRVGALPGLEGLLPRVVLGGEALLVRLKVRVGLRRHIPQLVGREAERLAARLLILDASLTVSGAGARDLVNALANDGLAHDQGRLAVVRLLGVLVRLGDGLHVMAIDLQNLPALGLEAHLDILRLRVLGHLVESDAIGIVHDDEVVKLLVASKGNGLVCDALLQAAIAAEDDDVVVDDGVLIRVEGRRRELASRRKANTVGDTLAKWASGCLDTRGPSPLRVARGLGVLDTEVGNLLHGKVESRNVQPRVEEHGAVARRENEAVAVDPCRVRRVVNHFLAIEDGANLGAAKWQTHVTGLSLGDGIDREATRLVGGLSKRGLLSHWLCSHLHGNLCRRQGATQASNGLEGLSSADQARENDKTSHG